MDADEQDEKCTTSNIAEEGREASSNPEIPERTREIYEKKYNEFMQWCKNKNLIEISEDSLLMYFYELPTKLKSSTLYSIYSMLRPMILLKHNINISNYARLLEFLKKKNVNYRPQRSLTLTREQVIKFFNEADDDRYLMIKVALIFGICGGCRRNELYNIKEEDIKEIDDNMLMIIVNDSRTNQPRTFPVMNDTDVDYIALYRKYANLRKGKSIGKERFFLKYTNKRCFNQVVGINTLGKIPYIIAEYLKLENPELYTGNCFRRSSKSVLAVARADLINKKTAEDPLGISIEQTPPSDNAMDEVNPQNGCIRLLDVTKYTHTQPNESSTSIENIYIKEEPSTPNSIDSSPSRSPSNTTLNHVEELNTKSGEIHLYNCTNITINIKKNKKIKK